MPIPHRDVRVVVYRFFNALLENTHREYLSDMPFPEAVAAMCILSRIALLEGEGEPLSMRRLARELQLSHTRLMRRLVAYERRGLIARDKNEVRVTREPLAAANAERAIRMACKLIIETGATLSKMDIGDSPDHV